MMLTGLPLAAQYFDFAVTDAGRLYFTTTLSTGAEDSRLKMFQLDGDGLKLYKTTTEGASPFSSSIIRPIVSGDAAIVGYGTVPPCLSPSCGIVGSRTPFTLSGAKLEQTIYNNAALSRNGRYLLGGTAELRWRVIELGSERSHDFPAGAGWFGAQSVTNNGTALALIQAAGTSSLLSMSADGTQAEVAGTLGAARGAVSPDGSRLVFERETATAYELGLTDLAGAPARVLASVARNLALPYPAGIFRYQPSFANDGTLLYLAPNAEGKIQAYRLGRAGDAMLVTSTATDTLGGVLSGNGEVAWLATGLGQILKVSLLDGRVEEAIPTTPFVTSTGTFAYPGSVIRLVGAGLTRETRFRLGETVLPLSELERDRVAVQVPWEYRPDARVLTVQGKDSPLVQRFGFTPLDRPTITFERDGWTGLLQAAHQDFHGLVTEQDPVVAGETVHLFARNLGAVNRLVKTGEPSPIDPPARVTSPMGCYLVEFGPQGVPVRAPGVVVPFAGLTGGSIGVYQIDLTIPADWSATKGTVMCVIDQADYRGDTAEIAIRPTAN